MAITLIRRKHTDGVVSQTHGAENQNVITARISDGLRNQPKITASPFFNKPVVIFQIFFFLTMQKWQKKLFPLMENVQKQNQGL